MTFDKRPDGFEGVSHEGVGGRALRTEGTLSEGPEEQQEASKAGTE